MKKLSFLLVVLMLCASCTQKTSQVKVLYNYYDAPMYVNMQQVKSETYKMIEFQNGDILDFESLMIERRDEIFEVNADQEIKLSNGASFKWSDVNFAYVHGDDFPEMKFVRVACVNGEEFRMSHYELLKQLGHVE